MKGMVKTLEVMIAVSMVIGTYALLYGAQQDVPDLETLSWKLSGINALQALDYSNELRYSAILNDTAQIESRINPYLPPNVEFMVQVCGASCDSPTISAEKSTSVQYLISGDADDPAAREIRLYMWSDE
jgi:hypothetical protein